MANIERTADAVWQGDSRSGKGKLSSGSGALSNEPYTWRARFEDEPATNPEELVAAAHAGCFTMALASTLARKGFTPDHLETHATLTMEKLEQGFTVTRMRLEVQGRVANMDQAAFQQVAEEAEKGCPISRLLRPGLQAVEVVARLNA